MPGRVHSLVQDPQDKHSLLLPAKVDEVVLGLEP
jgi:hypothetical protein